MQFVIKIEKETQLGIWNDGSFLLLKIFLIMAFKKFIYRRYKEQI